MWNDCGLCCTGHQPEQEPIIGIVGVVDAVLVGQQRSEQGADLQQMMPVFRRAGQTAHLQPQDQTDVVHGELGHEALVPEPMLGGLAALPLILVDDQDPLLGLPQRQGLSRQGVLPLPRLLVLQHLLRAGLPDIDDGQSVQVPSADLGRTQAADGRDGPRRARRRSGSCRQGFRAAHSPPPTRPELTRVAER